jgi:hypothetical protein
LQAPEDLSLRDTRQVSPRSNGVDAGRVDWQLAALVQVIEVSNLSPSLCRILSVETPRKLVAPDHVSSMSQSLEHHERETVVPDRAPDNRTLPVKVPEIRNSPMNPEVWQRLSDQPVVKANQFKWNAGQVTSNLQNSIQTVQLAGAHIRHIDEHGKLLWERCRLLWYLR